MISDGMAPQRLKLLAEHLSGLLAGTLKKIGVIHHAVTPDGPMLTTSAQAFLESDGHGAERIVAAACQEVWLTCSVPRPGRHDVVIKQAYDLGIKNPGRKQGFLTSEGRFVDRTEAEVIARDAGQISGFLIGSTLTSEDLW